MTSQIPIDFRRIRTNRRLSLKVAGELAGVSAQHLSRIESGLDARLSTIEAIASSLGTVVMLVPQDKAAAVRRYIATNGRQFRLVGASHEEDPIRSSK
jgi:transcriptional regulator with XRE-family HTH domain